MKIKMSTTKNMKKISVIFISVLMMASVACKKKTTQEVPSPATGAVEVSGSLTTQTWDASKKYLLKGTVFVNDGQTLTIPAGTVVMGDKATKGCLLINTGGKIDAQGTATSPIIFTSAEPVGARDEGDWCGVILLGKATVNQVGPSIEGITPAVVYGGTDDNDNSGTMKYCRIEFAGIALTPNNETNGLTFGGVGAGTTIDYIQSSFGGDDSFEWFGGSVKCKHLIAYAGWDDDFDTDFGFHGQIQYGLGVRDAFQADQSGSNGFESDNDANGDANTPKTTVTFTNMTLIGPIGDTSKAISGNYQSGAHIRRNSAMSLYNSILVGFKEGIRLDGTLTQTNFTTPISYLSNNIMIAAKSNKTTNATFLGIASGVSFSTFRTLWNASNTPSLSNGQDTVTVGNNAQYYAALSAAGINSNLFVMNNASYPADPNFAVTSGALLSGTATVPGTFFDVVTYRGAFGSTDWTDGWGNFDPKNVAY
jgi:hypothetical protein